ncbi:hypothetical protein [Synechococcus elongatus]|uniref:Uncharacterized protein n=1 Tax=Synechococcus elongatus PCC 11801 TaxID=2219813 RepID=A0AAN1QNE7_SYNEL|nr:hypothetical protein [Synechococcus elongatus]AZB72520.1 hypothetical protein DOP62_07125 [Synechococcus elongatus PCC 11801]
MTKAIAVGLLAIALIACDRHTSTSPDLELGVYADRRVALLAEPTLDAASATKTLIRGQVRIEDPETTSRYLLIEIYGECDRQNPQQSFLGLERVNDVDELLQQRTPRAGLGTVISLADPQPPAWVSDLMRRYCPPEAWP